ncbi:MAG: CAP domain-containing protein [Gemmatimonadota bacterium]
MCRLLLAASSIAPALVAPTLAAGPVALSTPTAYSGGRLAGSDAGPYARHLAELINEYRSYKGLAPLELVSDLNSIASEHSLEMAQHGRLSHDGFMERFDRTGARICVENVGWNFPHAEAQLDGWRGSPGHDRNLLEPKVVRMGIARSRTFVTFFACS